MSMDSLRSSVSEYSEKKSSLDREQELFDLEKCKLDDVSSVAAQLDKEIVSAVEDIQYEFSMEQADLSARADQLFRERGDLENQIHQEQVKLDTVQKKAEDLKRKKFTGGLNSVLQKCDTLLLELDHMLRAIESDRGVGVNGSSAADYGSVSTSDYKESGSTDDQKSGLWSKVFSKTQNISNGPKFGSFDLAPLQNGSSFFVKGTNYDQFIRDYYNSELSTYENLGENSFIRTISPSQIEGIYLGETEAADSSIFWKQHQSDGTKESFVEIASHIPKVKCLLERGISLEDIRKNPDLEKCVGIYFDPSNIPRVVESNGYYEFDTNGRHRILAAREAGYDIPVKIVGRRRWK